MNMRAQETMRRDGQQPRGLNTSLPLSLRLPNPPQPHLGRDELLRRLRGHLDRHAVLALTGPPGIGKTACALHLLHPLREPSRTARIQVATLQPGSLVATLRRVLALGDVLAPDWRLLDARPDAAMAALIDLADAGPWTFFLDDVDRADPSELRELLTAASTWSRAGRWVVTASALPAPLASVFPVEPLAPLDEEAMGQLLPPSPSLPEEERRACIRRAEGNPSRLNALLHEGHKDADGELARAWQLLALLRRPLQTVGLQALGIDPTAPILGHLEARGWLQRLPEGLLLRRDVDPPRGADGIAPADTPAEVAGRLATVNDPSARLEALRLLLELPEAPAATALLTEHGDDLCSQGYSADLWLLLDAAAPLCSAHPVLHDWRCWSAWEWGNPRAREAIGELDSSSWRRALLNARIAIARGAFPEAVRHCQTAAALAASDAEHDQAILRAARSLFSLGRIDDTVALFPLCRSRDHSSVVEREILRAECNALRNDGDEAASIVDSLLDTVPDLPASERLRAFLGMARVHLLRQRLRDSERVIDGLLRVGAERMADSVSGRTAVEIAAMIAVCRGNFDQLRQLAARLRSPHTPRVRSLFTDAYLATAAQFQQTPDESTAAINDLLRVCEEEGEGMALDVLTYADVLRVRLALRDGLPPDTLPAPVPESAPTAMLLASRDAMRQRHRARWGTPPTVPDPDSTGWSEHRILFGLVHATHLLHTALLDPDPSSRATAASQCARTLQRALQTAQTTGYALHEVDILRLRAQLHLATDRARLTEDLDRLDALAQRMNAPRLAEEVSALRLLTTADVPPWETLEAWAANETTAPERVRLCRALLGGQPPLDPIETALLEQLPPPFRCRTLGQPRGQHARWLPAHGIDPARRCIWTAGHVLADLSRHPLFLDLLTTLFRHGGTASKETLLTEVWQVGEYHPLNHDNRLRVAARKLRRLFEDAGAADPLVTLEDGYALRGPWRLAATPDMTPAPT